MNVLLFPRMDDNCSGLLKVILDNVHKAVLVSADVDAGDGVGAGVSPEESVIDPVNCDTIRSDHNVRYQLSSICSIEVHTKNFDGKD